MAWLIVRYFQEAFRKLNTFKDQLSLKFLRTSFFTARRQSLILFLIAMNFWTLTSSYASKMVGSTPSTPVLWLLLMTTSFLHRSMLDLCSGAYLEIPEVNWRTKTLRISLLQSFDISR